MNYFLPIFENRIYKTFCILRGFEQLSSLICCRVMPEQKFAQAGQSRDVRRQDYEKAWF